MEMSNYILKEKINNVQITWNVFLAKAKAVFDGT